MKLAAMRSRAADVSTRREVHGDWRDSVPTYEEARRIDPQSLNNRRKPSAPRVYEARNVEVYFAGERFDFDSNATISIAHLSDVERLVAEGRAIEERARGRGALIEIVAEAEAILRGYVIRDE